MRHATRSPSGAAFVGGSFVSRRGLPTASTTSRFTQGTGEAPWDSSRSPSRVVGHWNWNAQYLVFGALPPVATFYERAGGARGAVPGWNVARGLIPFRFTRDALIRLEDLAGGFAVGTEEA